MQTDEAIPTTRATSCLLFPTSYIVRRLPPHIRAPGRAAHKRDIDCLLVPEGVLAPQSFHEIPRLPAKRYFG